MVASLIITVGAPGAGKSTWADANLPVHTLRLERERMREAFWGSRQAYYADPLNDHDKSYIISSTMYNAAKHWPQNRSIALTDTGLFFPSVKRFMGLRAKTVIMVFDIPDNELRERNRTRPTEHRLPDDALERFIEAFRDPRAWWRKYPHAYAT